MNRIGTSFHDQIGVTSRIFAHSLDHYLTWLKPEWIMRMEERRTPLGKLYGYWITYTQEVH